MVEIDEKIVSNGVVLAVSGGVDSMVMLDVFVKRFPLNLGLRPFEVVTVNHHIRPNALDDCLLVDEYCRKHGVKCAILDVFANQYAQSNKCSLETAARILRHQAIREYAKGRIICLAHQRDDQAETVLMHLLRGSGKAGAVGMRKFDETYYRPLLEVSRKEIEQYAQDNLVPFNVDQTNLDDAITRNNLRLNIMPLLRQINAQADQHLCEYAVRCGLDEDYFDEVISRDSERYYSVKDGQATIYQTVFLSPKSLQYRILSTVFEKMGVFFDIESKHIEEIVALNSNKRGKKICLPFDLIATKGYNKITITKREKQFFSDLAIPFSVGLTHLGQSTVRIEPYCGNGLRFDISAIPADAVIRTRRSGDFFTKFAGGRKKLKDYFIDLKIEQRDKDRILLVASGRKVLIVCGYEISDEVKVGSNTPDGDIYTISICEGEE